MTQLNTPYPSTTVLTGYLKALDHDVHQCDLSIELALKILSRDGLNSVFDLVSASKVSKKSKPSTHFFIQNFNKILTLIDPTIQFLQGKDPTFALRITQPDFYPAGPRFKVLHQIHTAQGVEVADPLAYAFGTLGIQDRAKFLASLFIDDIFDVIKESIDPDFEISRYGESLAASVPVFDLLEEKINKKNPTLIQNWLVELTKEKAELYNPDVVGLSVPFPGNVLSALIIAKTFKNYSKSRIKTVMGGGYVNTELREISDPRFFNYIDYLVYDDGEKPFEVILDHLNGNTDESNLLRTRIKNNNKVEYINSPKQHDVPQNKTGFPTYKELPIDRYLSIFEMLNPMHRIWSDGRWNKLMLAHGCYWKKCTFCDVTLDYIGRYDPSKTDLIIQRIKNIIAETGQRGFHFVDEAAPPAALKALAERLIQKNLPITWWGNIRFDKFFTKDICQLLSESGCVAVSGGLEVASNRLLKLINKGTTVEQVARVTHAFTQSGIMVHAYLMYGYATQTVQETIDSLELVRQLFQEGCIQSGYWHRFSVTAHSPVGHNPENYGIKLHPPKNISFAKNDIPFTDTAGIDHDLLGQGLKKALYNYMYGIGLDEDVRNWFEHKVPKTTVKSNVILKAIQNSST